MNGEPRYRVPPGVEFMRWREGGGHGTGEWVVHHSGTGETLRLSEAALALLGALIEGPGQDRAGLAAALAGLLDESMPSEELSAVVDDLLRALLRHECIEVLPCD